MSKSYSVFVEDKYYYDFIALYNSWKYYENKIPMKVYVAGELDSDKRANIEKLVDVIDVSMEGYTIQQFKGKYLFKWIGLLQYMDEYEILLDADTIFLSNMDFLFDILETGKMVVAREEVDVLHYSYVDRNEWDAEHKRIQSELKKYIGDLSDGYTKNLITPTYNAGLTGFSKVHHKFLLEKCIEILISDFDAKKNPISHLEQFMMSLLIQMYSVDTHILPQLEWMNTWNWHRNPKKILKIEDGKFRLYNDGGNKINFYHFTGGVGVEDTDGLLKTCKPHHMYEYHKYEAKFNRTHIEKLWYETHENPALLLYEYFANKGL
jgi:lipopolysaccharide biosynthesis glycosyltransferase